MLSVNTYEKEFLQLLKKISQYEQAINVMYWDMRTGAPKKGKNTVQKRSDNYRQTFFR